MDRNEAIEILEIIDFAYDMNFHENKKKAEFWISKLEEKGNYTRTLNRTHEYIEEKPFPPTIADILIKELKDVNKKLYNVEDDDEEYVDLSDPEVRQWIEELQEKYDAMAERGELTIHDL